VVAEGVPAAPAGAGVVLAVVALALAGTLAPFTLFAFGQSRVSAEVAGAFLNLEPLVGAIAGVVAFGDPVGLVQVAGGLAILAGIALSSLPLIAAGRMARRAALIVAARAAGDTVAAASTVAGASAGAGAGAGIGAGAGAEAGAWRLGAGAGAGAGREPPETGPLPQARTYESDTVHQRMCRMPHSYPSEPRPGGRNRAIAVVRGSKFGTGLTGEGRPGTAGTKRAKTRPGGRVAGRPPARGLRPGRGTALAGRGTALAGRGTAPAGRGRRTGEAGRRARRQVLLQVGG